MNELIPIDKIRKWIYRASSGKFYLVKSYLHYSIFRHYYLYFICKFGIKRITKYLEKVKINALGNSSSAQNLLEYYYNRSSVRFHFTEMEIMDIVNSIPTSLKKAAIETSNNILHNKFRFRNMETYEFPGSINWHYRHHDHLSWNWDLNRHDFFVTIGMAYYYSHDTKYVELLYRLWKSWIDQNPPSISDNWKEPFEVAIRLRNWMWSFFLLLYSKHSKTDFTNVILEYMYYHALYLKYNIELHSENNHLFLQSKTLLEYSLLFHEYDKNHQFRNLAQKIFTKQCRKQILEDGCHSELCSGYHRIVLSEILEIYHLLKVNSDSIGLELKAYVERMINFSKGLIRSDGTYPLLGESSAHDVNIRYDPFQSKTVLNYWINHSNKNSLFFNNVKSITPLGLLIYPNSGYGVMHHHDKNSDIHCLVDFGPFTLNDIPFHGHSDKLHFALHAMGNDIFIDPGFYYSMEKTQQWIEYFRSTAAHNTMTIDGKDQSTLNYATGKLIESPAALIQSMANDTSMIITAQCIHNSNTKKPIIHQRTFELKTDTKILSIEDKVIGEGSHSLSWYFHCGIGISTELDTVNKQIKLNNRSGTTVAFLQEKNLKSPEISTLYGSEKPYAGWAAYSTTKLEKIYTIRFRSAVQLPCDTLFTVKIT